MAVAPGQEYEKAEAAFDSVLTDLMTDGPSDNELQKAKNSLTAAFYKSFKTNNGTAEQLANHKALYDDWKALYDFVGKINAVTAKQVTEVTARYFQAKNSTTVVLVPEGGQS